MKKFVLAAMLLGLTVGSTYASPSFAISEAQSEIPESHLSFLLTQSSAFFGITLDEANQAYESGGLIITWVRKNTYKVEYSSSWGEWAIDGTL